MKSHTILIGILLPGYLTCGDGRMMKCTVGKKLRGTAPVSQLERVTRAYVFPLKQCDSRIQIQSYSVGIFTHKNYNRNKIYKIMVRPENDLVRLTEEMVVEVKVQ